MSTRGETLKLFATFAALFSLGVVVFLATVAWTRSIDTPPRFCAPKAVPKNLLTRHAPVEEAAWPQTEPIQFVDFPDAKSVPKTIVEEPKYQKTPRYCLTTFGLKAERRVWFVEDGDTLYVDRNGNGILGEPGEAVSIGPSRLADSQVYEVGSINGGANKPVFRDVSVYRYNSEGKTGYVIEGWLNDTLKQYAGWGAIFSESEEKATVICFGAAVAPRPLRVRPWEPGDKEHELSFALATPGFGERSTAWVAYGSVPADVHPVVRIQWPGQTDKHDYYLKERC